MTSLVTLHESEIFQILWTYFRPEVSITYCNNRFAQNQKCEHTHGIEKTVGGWDSARAGGQSDSLVGTTGLSEPVWTGSCPPLLQALSQNNCIGKNLPFCKNDAIWDNGPLTIDNSKLTHWIPTAVTFLLSFSGQVNTYLISWATTLIILILNKQKQNPIMLCLIKATLVSEVDSSAHQLSIKFL